MRAGDKIGMKSGKLSRKKRGMVRKMVTEREEAETETERQDRERQRDREGGREDFLVLAALGKG